MKLICISVIVLILQSSNLNAQEEIIDPIEQAPLFPGGLDSLWCFIENNLRPEIINSDSESVRYVFKFVIDSSGIAKDFDFLTTLPKDKVTKNDSLKKMEIVRVLTLMPKWEPAKQNNKSISCWYTIPISTPILKLRCKKIESPLKKKTNSH